MPAASFSCGKIGACCVMPKAVEANVMHIPQDSIGNPDCAMAERSTDLSDPCHLSCVVLCGHRLANEVSGCQPRVSTDEIIPGSASDFTITDGLRIAGSTDELEGRDQTADFP